MPLMRCPDCGKEHSDAAPACPNCGRPNAPTPEGASNQASTPAAAKNVTAGQVGCVILIAIIFFTWLGTHRNQPESLPSPPAVAPEAAPPPPPQGPQLELIKWNWSKEYGYAKIEGQVKNITDGALENVEAVVTFTDAKGDFIKSDDSLIDFNPILPGQTSPFSVMSTYNPAMKTASVQFKYLMGGSIAHRQH